MQALPTSDHNSAEFVIGRRQLYILPTKVGWYFGLILVALFAIAVKFDNQPAFMMLFILVGLGNAVMLATHRNVINLVIEKGIPQPCYAGEIATSTIHITNKSKRARRAIYVSCADHHSLIDLAPAERTEVQISHPTQTRGIHHLAPVVLSSQYPVGLFFCWTKQTFYEHTLTVYPRTKNSLGDVLRFAGGTNDSEQGAMRVQHGDFQGLRNYQDGDRLRDVHWPSFAKSQKLVSKEYEATGISTLAFNWTDLPNTLSVEDKLSQLSYWLTSAERSANLYSLTMPSVSIAAERGPAHLHECLSALAEFAPESQAKHTLRMANKKGLQGSKMRLVKLFKRLNPAKPL